MAKFARAVITTVFTVIGSAIGGPIGAAIGTFVGTMLGKIILPPSKGKPRAAAATSLQIGEVPRQAIVGRAATAGSLVDAFNYGGKYGTDWEVLVIALADHRCDALEGFYVNDSYVPFAGDGAVAGYNNQLSIYWRPGTETQSVPSVLTANGPGWTVNDNGAGVSYAVVAYKADAADAKNPVWPNGRPRFLFVVRGALCYDPRLDSTVGGAGAHRWVDPATWTWSENPIVTRYKFARGFFACDRVNQPDQLLIGRGLSTVEAPPANLFHRANLCDEIVDGEPRYRVGGLIEATETYIDVESDFAAACAGTIIQPEGSVEIDPGEAKAPVVTITDADLVVGSKVKRRWFLGIADRAWVNSVVASYIEPSQKWSALAAPVRRSIADIQADGAPREEALSLGFVQWQKQAGRVAEIVRRMGRLFLRAELVLPPRFCELEEGDWIVWQSDRYLNGQAYTFRVEAWGSDKAWQHSVVLRQISASCYADTAPLTDGSVAVQQAARPAIGAPAAGNWSVSAGHLAAGGIRTPALIVSGASDDPSARFVRLEYVQSVAAPTASTIWSDAGVTGPDVKRREIAVAAGGSYWVAISYVVDGVQGDRLVLGSVTALTVAYPDGTAVESLKPGEPGATNDANLDDPTQLTINEKTRLIPTEAVRGGRKAQLRSRMVALGISVTALDAAEANWLTYRDSVTPAWNASSQHSTINRATWNSLSVLYDAALDAGDKAVSEEDAKRANWANVAQTPNAPADNASSDINLTVTGTGLVRSGNTVTKSGGAFAWDTQAYSNEAFTSGAFCAFYFSLNGYIAAGLNQDPTTNTDIGTIDFCFYTPGVSANLHINENGSVVGGGSPINYGPVTASTVLSVVYDNEYVRYLKDGVEVRAISVGAGKLFYFDSSLVGGSITNIRFGPYAAANASISFTSTGNQSANGNTVSKRAGADGWNAKSTSSQTSAGTAFVSFKLPTTNTFCGLHQVGNSALTYDSMAASFHRSGNGRWYCWSVDNAYLDLGTSYNGVVFSDKSDFIVTYDGADYRWHVDGVLMLTVPIGADLVFRAGVALFDANSKVSDIQFGPYTDRTWSNIKGGLKPENNSTRGPNRVFNGDASEGLAGWTVTTNDGGSFQISGAAEAIGGASSFRLLKSALGVGHLTITSRPIPVVPGQKLFYRFKAYGSHATASGLYFRINQRGQGPEPTDMDGHSGSLSDVQSNIGVSLSPQSYEAPYTVPAGVYWVSISVLNWIAGPQLLIVDDIYLGESQLGADVTLTAQVTTVAPDDVTINADYLGAIIAGQFNKVVTPSVTRGGVSVRTDNRATYSATNITGGLIGFVTMNNTNGSADKGRATITNCTSTGSYQHNIFWDGVLIASYVVRFLVQAASPPSGGGGSGSYSGNFDVTGFTIFGTGFVEVNRISNLSNLNGNILRCILPFATYQATSNTNTVSRSAVVKAQYSPAGANSWTDVAAAVTGSFSTWVMQDFSGDEGTVSFNHSTAISVGAAYFDVRLVAAMNVSGANSSIYFTGGTFSAEIGT